MTAMASASINCKQQAYLLVRGDASHEQTRNCLGVTKVWSGAPDGLDTKQWVVT
jgi:hypothetical protein